MRTKQVYEGQDVGKKELIETMRVCENCARVCVFMCMCVCIFYAASKTLRQGKVILNDCRKKNQKGNDVLSIVFCQHCVILLLSFEKIKEL